MGAKIEAVPCASAPVFIDIVLLMSSGCKAGFRARWEARSLQLAACLWLLPERFDDLYCGVSLVYRYQDVVVIEAGNDVTRDSGASELA